MKRTKTLSLFLWLLGTSITALASPDVELRISELTAIDRQYMAGQRNELDETARTYLGRSFSGERDRDLDLLQTLLDKGLVRNNQTQQLQAMGIVLGDLLSDELGLDWVVYEDKAGRSRALRLDNTEVYLFPVTMISRRREVGNTATVDSIYRKAVASVKRRRPPLPFQ